MTTNEPMTQERLDEIEAALNDATPGPWSAETRGHLITHVNDADGIPIGICQECTNDATYEAPNAELIAHAPEYIAYLLAEVERLRARLTVDDEMVERAAKALYLSDFMRRNNWATEDRARVSLESAKGGQIGGWMSTLEDARAALHVALNPYETEEA